MLDTLHHFDDLKNFHDHYFYRIKDKAIIIVVLFQSAGIKLGFGF